MLERQQRKPQGDEHRGHGGLASVLKVLMDADIDIEYTYAFVVENGARACAILRLSDTELGEKILSEAGVPMVSEEDILRI